MQRLVSGLKATTLERFEWLKSWISRSKGWPKLYLLQILVLVKHQRVYTLLLQLKSQADTF